MKKAMFMTPVVSALDKNGNYDVEANKEIWDFLIKGGVDGIAILGSIGEFPGMPISTKKKIVDIAQSHINNRVKLYVGTGSMTIEETVELSNYAVEKGVDGVMVISPYYFSLSNTEIEYYYKKVLEQINGNVMLYNYPERTGYDLTPEITVKLLRKYKKIIGYKDSVAEMGHTRKVISTTNEEFPDFFVLSGFDENCVHNVMCGGGGAMGGLSNICPNICSAWVKAINNKDFDEVARIQKIIDKLMDIYTVGGPFIPVMKKAMMLLGLPLTDCCVKPIIEVDEEKTNKIKSILKEVSLI